MRSIQELIDVLDSLQVEFGRSTFKKALMAVNRRRLTESGRRRSKRKKFPWSTYERFYRLQGGICPVCREPMVLLRGKVEIDHLDPNETEFNAERNLRLAHSTCNRMKSARSVYEQAKEQGGLVTDLLTPGGIGVGRKKQ